MEGKFFFTEHSLEEIDNDDLNIEDVQEIAVNGEVIKEYPEDKPFPSTLKLGWVGFWNSYPVHVVSAVSDKQITIIITAYKPNPEIWNEDFKTKKKGKL